MRVTAVVLAAVLVESSLGLADVVLYQRLPRVDLSPPSHTIATSGPPASRQYPYRSRNTGGAVAYGVDWVGGVRRRA